MATAIEFIADIASERKRSLLEEIIRNTTFAVEREGMQIRICFESEERPTFMYERTGCYATGEIESEKKEATIVISRKARNTLNDPALTGLVYSIIGSVLGTRIYASDEEEEDEEQIDLFSALYNTQREALFDAMMLSNGGTVEALVAYKVETTIATIREVATKENVEFDFDQFACYCRTLEQLYPSPGNLIESIVKMRSERHQKPIVEEYEN